MKNPAETEHPNGEASATGALPPYLTLELTRHCNFRCPFCYCVWHEFPELAKRDLPTRAWKRIIDRALAGGVKSLLFTGGEILLRRDAEELVRYTRERAPGCDLSLFTNGSRMTEERLKRFRKLRIRLSTSLPGLRTYGAMTGTRRSCLSVLELLARAKELRWPFDVSLTATRVNAPEFADLFAAAAVAGARTIQAGAMMLEGRGRTRIDLALTPQEWNALKEQIRALPRGKTRYQFCDEILCECRDQPLEYLAHYGRPDAVPCPAGKTFGVIGPNGKFRRCLHTVADAPW